MASIVPVFGQVLAQVYKVFNGASNAFKVQQDNIAFEFEGLCPLLHGLLQ